MITIYNSNGFTVESDTKLYGWNVILPHCTQWINLRLAKAQFEIDYDGKSRPYIYNCDSFVYFVWYGRIAFRVANDYTLAEYMLSKADYENEITFAFNFIIAFISPFIKRLALHGCAVATASDEAVLILGDSGIGKSTLLRKLLEIGYDYLSEEVVFINTLSKTVYQSNNLIKINSELFNEYQGDKIITTVGDKTAFWNSKYTVREKEIKLKSICVIKRDATMEPNVKELLKAEMVKYILEDYLYVKAVLRYLPFSEMIKMTTRILNNTKTILYKTTDYPDINIIMRIIN